MMYGYVEPDGRAWLDALVAPRGVALVGVSNDPTRISGRALAYLKRYGYAGAIYPVNNRRETVQGLKAYRRLADVPAAPDLALISLGADDVLEALEACVERGVLTAIVYASGFAEQDQRGADRQAEITAIAANSDLRILGPNCMGAVSTHSCMTATFATAFDDGALAPGGVALITQSGAFSSFTYGLGRSNGTRFGFLATTGNEADLTLAEVLEGVIELPWITSALVHMEGLRDLHRFSRATKRARELRKPIAVIKVGTTSIGAQAARAHTGASVGDDDEYQAVFDAHGVVRVASIGQLADMGQVFQAGSRTTGRRVCLVSISGGTGALMADVAVAAGLDVPELPEDVRAKIGALLPPFASTRNPVDVTGAVLDNLGSFEAILVECMLDTSTDVVVLTVGNAAATETALVDAFIAASRHADKPLYVAWVGGSGAPARALTTAGIPTFADPNRAVEAASLTPSGDPRSASRA